MSIDALQAGLWPYLLVIAFGFLPSEIWRVAAVFLSRGFDERAEIFVWVRAVATTLVAGVVAKILLAPTGALVAVPLAWRFGALALGVVVFFLARRSVMAGVLAGEAALVGATWWLAGALP